MMLSNAVSSGWSTDVRTNDKKKLDHIVKQALVRRRVVISFFYANLLWWNVTYAQRSSASFGPCTERILGYAPRCLAVTNVAAAASEIAILSADPPALHFITVNTEGALVDTGAIVLAKPQASAAPFETDRQGRTSYVVVSEDGREVSIVRRAQQKNDIQTLSPRSVYRSCSSRISTTTNGRTFSSSESLRQGSLPCLAEPEGRSDRVRCSFPRSRSAT